MDISPADAHGAPIPLGWSHYVELLTVGSADERRFYEIEAAASQWGVRELRRQIASSLYERLALSRNKDEIRRLATGGQVVERPPTSSRTRSSSSS